MKKNKNMLWGIILVIIGLILSLNVLEIIKINLFFDGWWTLLIIIPSLIGMFTDKDKISNIIWFIIGIFLLLVARDIIDFTILLKLFIPIVLVVIGLSLIFKDSLSKKIKDEIKKLEKKDILEYCATFSSEELNFKDEKFQGCELTSVFASVKCDLRESDISNKSLIKTTSIFGGIDILVPSDVSVKVVSTSIFGGVSNKTKEVNSKKVLYVEAICLFGGVDIK